MNAKELVTKLVEKHDLTKEEAESAFDKILDSTFNEIVVSAILVLLRSKGETPSEIAGMVRSMKKACKPVVTSKDNDLLDIVGTGGDGADTINISTGAAILAAACGCTVAKCGNRSVSSACGSADVLEMSGVAIDLAPNLAGKCIDQCGMGFLFAPINHPSVKVVAPVRKSLGVRTVFNILGPIVNAASANKVVIGVFEEHLVSLLAQALIEIGMVERAIVLHGCGLDEISPIGPSLICEIRNNSSDKSKKSYSIEKYEFDPLSVNIQRCKVEDLKGGPPEQNMEELRSALGKGEFTNAKRDSIILNCAVGLYVYGKVDSIADGVTFARSTLYEGKGIEKLLEFIKVSSSLKN